MLTKQALSPGMRSVPVRRRGEQLERDLVVVEEPLEIHVDGKPLVVTMRTPGYDAELAAGFLFGEGWLRDVADIASVDVRSGSAQRDTQIRVANFSGDTVDVTLKEGATKPTVAHADREFRATAACGVCGKTEIKDLDSDLPAIVPIKVDPILLETLPDKLRLAQELFKATGGIHAAGIFNRQGSLLCSYEDIGRHNAVDKVVGHFVLENAMPLSDRILVVSGRTGFELVQKALKASIPVMVSVGAASSLAVQMATDAGMALYSFARPGHGNLHIKE
jgi:FdhD protein